MLLDKGLRIFRWIITNKRKAREKWVCIQPECAGYGKENVHKSQSEQAESDTLSPWILRELCAIVFALDV